MKNTPALTKAARALGMARAKSMTPAERTESARKAAVARWGEGKERTMTVVAVEARLSTAEEVGRGEGPVHRRRIKYNLHPDDARARLRAALADGSAFVADTDLMTLSAGGAVRIEALQAVYAESELRDALVSKEPDSIGDRMAAEREGQSWEIVPTIRKAFGPRPGLGAIQERVVEYRVPSRAVLTQQLLKAMRSGEIERGALAELNAGRLNESTLLAVSPEARQQHELRKAAAECDRAVERLDAEFAELRGENSMTDAERYAKHFRR